MKNKFKQIAQTLANRLQSIEYNKLPISDYNKQYIGNLKPALDYYLKIYSYCLLKGLQSFHLPLSKVTLVDYGRGSGFLSILAKQIGFERVIYIDLNSKSVETIQILKKELGVGPDIILHGDSDRLKHWCKENNCKPHLLIATDLIEHIYNLEIFFNDLISINNQIQMIFTTASTPFNPYVKHRLHQYMLDSETGTTETPNYYTLRFQYIQENFPTIPIEAVALIAKKTRGLIFKDIKKAIETNTYPILNDSFNTCDPRTGNWTERILPIQTYQTIVQPFGYSVQIQKGFYNTKRSNSLTANICKWINKIINISGKAGFLLAPFIILHIKKV